VKSIPLLALAVAAALVAPGCSGGGARVSATVNSSASPAAGLLANPLQWRVITSAIDKHDSTMWTLYGNDTALDFARTHAHQDYPAGSQLSLVTWTQRDDPRYFGARIPDRVKSVEFVSVSAAPDGHPSYSYAQYEGASQTKSSTQEGLTPNDRTTYLLSQRAAVVP
jgi:hypothetical protein